jgi:hypothetical protein
MTIISDHDLVPLACDPSCKHTADDPQMTSYNWKNSKESLGSSQDICLIFLITLKNVENIPLSDYRFPPFCIFANTYEAAMYIDPTPHTTGATSGEGTANPSGAPEFTPGF